MKGSERIIVALDASSAEQARRLVEAIGPELRFVKVGMELFYAAGERFIAELKERELQVFLDLKMHDIPHTVGRAAAVLSSLGVDLINVHCSGGQEMMRQARQAVGKDTKVIGVTQLTSIDQVVLNEELLIGGSVLEVVEHYAQMACQAGLNGVVCSPWEAARVKQACGSSFLTVTPGVRPTGSAKGDQKRIMTPGEAVRQGSDYLVIGRPITQASQPQAAFQQIIEEVEVALCQ